ncbi:MAG: hypothetical protein IIA67_03365 [Planctomycetes bacterium]|nr:hypothetical protein [Planctomycetota bacterium]
MMTDPWILAAVAASAVTALAVALAWKPLRAARREARFAQARQAFRQRREWLEAKFFDLASHSGRPRGLRWTDCDFADEVTYARDRRSGRLSALVAVTIGFEAIEGGGMEEVEAVSNLRAATALFQFNGSRRKWETDGRAIFNLNPHEAVEHFQSDMELLVHGVVGGPTC